MSRFRASLRFAIAACFALLLATHGGAQQSTPVTHTSTLGAPRADVLEDGTLVVSLVATGDLQGLATLILHPAATGGYAGEWAFAVSHADQADPVTGIDEDLLNDAPTADANHRDHGFLRLIRRGSLQGSVGSASITFDDTGALTGISAALTITQGVREFSGATGSGRATLASLTLTF